MEIKLWKKPKNCIIVEGFPGFGLVGTIATEFLLDHLGTEQIGKIIFNDMPAMVAIHEGKIVEPLGVFYNSKYNIAILHAITAATHYEWEMADTVSKIALELKAREIISLEGVGSGETAEGSRVFYYSNDAKISKKGNCPPEGRNNHRGDRRNTLEDGKNPGELPVCRNAFKPAGQQGCCK